MPVVPLVRSSLIAIEVGKRGRTHLGPVRDRLDAFDDRNIHDRTGQTSATISSGKLR
jgi:hypothetical protein